MPQQDARARLQPKNKLQTQFILGPDTQENILYPLHATGGVLFPYMPIISTGNAAEYDQTTFVHSNYNYNAYVRSYPRPITMTADFTAQTNDEALYLLAVLHFFRSVTKMYFGITPYERAGTPPPVLIFNYLGEFMFNNVPVIVKSFDYTLDNNVDYVPVNTSNFNFGSAGYGVQIPINNFYGFTFIPTKMTVSVELETQYVPIDLRNNFNLDAFRRGRLLGKGYL